MSVTKEQIIKGIVSYADKEIMPVVSTPAKWAIGTAMTMALNDKGKIDVLLNSPVIKMLGIENEDGTYDIDKLYKAMKETAEKYGKMSISYPVVGTLTFSSQDVELLKKYIEEA